MLAKAVMLAKDVGKAIIRNWHSVFTVTVVFFILAAVSAIRVNPSDKYKGYSSILFSINYVDSIRPNIDSVSFEERLFDAWLEDKVFLKVVNDRVDRRIQVQQGDNLEFVGQHSLQFIKGYDRITVSLEGDNRQEVQNVLEVWTEEFVTVIIETFSRNQFELSELKIRYQKVNEDYMEAQSKLEQFIERGDIERTKKRIDYLNNVLNAAASINNSLISTYTEKLIKYEQLAREIELIRERTRDGDPSLASMLSIIAVQAREFGSVPSTLQFNAETKLDISSSYVDTVSQSLQEEYRNLQEWLRVNTSKVEKLSYDRIGLDINAIQDQLQKQIVLLDQLENQYQMLVQDRDRLRGLLFDLRGQIVSFEYSNNSPILVKPVGIYTEKIPAGIFVSSYRGLILRMLFGVVSGLIVGSLIVLYRDRDVREKLSLVI